jgi:hypothetical protein
MMNQPATAVNKNVPIPAIRSFMGRSITSNENKISDGWRRRASIEVEVF